MKSKRRGYNAPGDPSDLANQIIAPLPIPSVPKIPQAPIKKPKPKEKNEWEKFVDGVVKPIYKKVTGQGRRTRRRKQTVGPRRISYAHSARYIYRYHH